MPLKDLLKRRDKHKGHDEHDSQRAPSPEFTFLRTDTNTQEIIQPPSYPDDSAANSASGPTENEAPQPAPKRPSARFRSVSSISLTSNSSTGEERRRLSQRLHLRSHSYASSRSSVNVPSDLPSISDGAGEDGEEKEAMWEERATRLARGNPLGLGGVGEKGRGVGDAGSGAGGGDENIQEAIRLHEAGDLERSTAMFGRLANPAGANDALSQVLYGLALRHGWGCPPNPTLAITYLSAAASNSAAIESSALASGLKKGGAAKGELVLAIFELANCFRHGWGVGKDPVAAKQYYETAANLGDTDAMNEVGWCYLEGFGGKKDKYTAAKYYRLAEQNGSKTLGNSWSVLAPVSDPYIPSFFRRFDFPPSACLAFPLPILDSGQDIPADLGLGLDVRIWKDKYDPKP